MTSILGQCGQRLRPGPSPCLTLPRWNPVLSVVPTNLSQLWGLGQWAAPIQGAPHCHQLLSPDGTQAYVL